MRGSNYYGYLDVKNCLIWRAKEEREAVGGLVLLIFELLLMQPLFGLISALGNKVIKFGKSLGIIIITSLHIMIF